MSRRGDNISAMRTKQRCSVGTVCHLAKQNIAAFGQTNIQDSVSCPTFCID